MRALTIVRAARLPELIKSVSSSRSCSLGRTTYFLAATSFVWPPPTSIIVEADSVMIFLQHQ